MAATAVCRPSIGGCDPEETCPGGSADCPADVRIPDATACEDGNPCTAGDTCLAGVCQGGGPALVLSPDSLDFATTLVGESAGPMAVDVTYQGDLAMTLTGAEAADRRFPWPASRPGRSLSDRPRAPRSRSTSRLPTSWPTAEP